MGKRKAYADRSSRQRKRCPLTSQSLHPEKAKARAKPHDGKRKNPALMTSSMISWHMKQGSRGPAGPRASRMRSRPAGPPQGTVGLKSLPLRPEAQDFRENRSLLRLAGEPAFLSGPAAGSLLRQDWHKKTNFSILTHPRAFSPFPAAIRSPRSNRPTCLHGSRGTTILRQKNRSRIFRVRTGAAERDKAFFPAQNGLPGNIRAAPGGPQRLGLPVAGFSPRDMTARPPPPAA